MGREETEGNMPGGSGWRVIGMMRKLQRDSVSVKL